MSSQYQRSVPLEVRRAEGERVRAKHPDKIPIIVERATRSRAPELDKKKFLVPSDLTVGQLCFLIRQRVSMRPEEALFFFVKNSLPPSSSPLSAVYEEHHEEDLFLYMTYSNESVYGAWDGGRNDWRVEMENERERWHIILPPIHCSYRGRCSIMGTKGCCLYLSVFSGNYNEMHSTEY